MQNRTLGEMETKFADLIWEHEPVSSRALVSLCAETFCWKRTTTYTMLRRLCDYGLFQNAGGTVSSLVTREEYRGAQGERFVEEAFGGSLPQFIAAFAGRRRLSAAEIAELRRLIDAHEEG